MARNDPPATDRIDTLDVHPTASSRDRARVDLGDVQLLADDAHVDDDNRLVLTLDNLTVARVETAGVPLGVPNLVRRAIQHGETATWEADTPDVDVDEELREDLAVRVDQREGETRDPQAALAAVETVASDLREAGWGDAE